MNSQPSAIDGCVLRLFPFTFSTEIYIMAFRPSTSSSPAAAAPATRRSRTGQEYEAAVGFINIYVPTAAGNGARRKLGTIPLNASNATQKQIFDRLKEGTTDEERADLVKRLMAIVQVEFNEQIDENAVENQVATF